MLCVDSCSSQILAAETRTVTNDDNLKYRNLSLVGCNCRRRLRYSSSYCIVNFPSLEQPKRQIAPNNGGRKSHHVNPEDTIVIRHEVRYSVQPKHRGPPSTEFVCGRFLGSKKWTCSWERFQLFVVHDKHTGLQSLRVNG